MTPKDDSMLTREEYESRITDELRRIMGRYHPTLPEADDFLFAGWDEQGNAVISLQQVREVSCGGEYTKTGIGNIRLIGPPSELLILLSEFELLNLPHKVTAYKREHRHS